MGIPSPMTKELASEALQIFKAAGHSDLDTAIMYQGGQTEVTLGELQVGSSVKVAIKANPWYRDGKTFDDPVAGLEPAQLKEQVRTSLKHLKLDKAQLLYLHAPDHVTPIRDTLSALHDLHKEGLFEQWGLSNYASWQVVDIYHLCKAMNMPPPSVYQARRKGNPALFGMYNAVTREVEKELLPALRHCGMQFYAYNPLAGGVLTGKWRYDDQPQSGRFNINTVWGNRYRERFWQRPLFDALERVRRACDAHATTPTAASLRWLLHHGALRDGDGVIIGGSSVEQVAQNAAACAEGPLPSDVVAALDDAWLAARGNCPLYFR
ncbi:aldo-keto reductase family 7, member A2 [Tribonema minus]|uniref:Aldo-keto reductase family 7, member A2 n=1 Tax=Tribonema minus TaxID=303371 RepID=A0A835YS59_9STRA|nr:aldo-keto reductase family 7, member A2 [Tribonema minus]